MSKKSNGEFWDSSANWMIGCQGCELAMPHYTEQPKHVMMPDAQRCYAWQIVTQVNRKGGNKGMPPDFFEPMFKPEAIRALNWSDLRGTDRTDPPKPWLDGYPRIIFWNDMSDAFGQDAPWSDEWLRGHLPAFERSPHINLFLTKQPKRMASFFDGKCPTPIWAGTTITAQPNMTRGRDLLGGVDAAVWWLSIEPMVKPVDLEVLAKMLGHRSLKEMGASIHNRGKELWIILGGESGSLARPTHPLWIETALEKSVEAGFPTFVKQRGQWAVVEDEGPLVQGRPWLVLYPDGNGVLKPARRRIPALLKSRTGAVLMQRQADKGPLPIVAGQRWAQLPRIPERIAVQASFL